MTDKERLMYLKCKVKNLTKEVDALTKKSSTEHLGHAESHKLKGLIADRDKFAKRLKQEKYNYGKTNA